MNEMLKHGTILAALKFANHIDKGMKPLSNQNL